MCCKKITRLEIFLIYAATQDTATPPPPPIAVGKTGEEGTHCSDVTLPPCQSFLNVREKIKERTLEYESTVKVLFLNRIG